MAIRNIRKDGDEILRKISKPVEKMTPRLAELIDDMFETMEFEDGVGLAAPQVGVLRRIIVLNVDDKKYALVNPEIVEAEGTQCGQEGCLSVPDVYMDVIRPNRVVVKALDRDMNEVTLEGTELLARALCHEIDHLNGVLFKDIAERE